MRKILVVDGHPDPDRAHLNHALADRYVRSALEHGSEVRRINVAELDFPLLRNLAEFERETTLEAIKASQDDVRWADHLVVFYPLWHGDVPARLKGFIEQTFRPGVTLKGKSARIVLTMGMPVFFFRAYMGAHSVKALERMLALARVSPIDTTLLGGAGDPCESKTRAWFAQMAKIAKEDGDPGSRRAAAAVATLAKLTAVAAAGYAAYALGEWARYGSVRCTDDADLDRVMPDYEVRVRHVATIDAPADIAFDALSDLDFTHLPTLVGALFRTRELLMRAPHVDQTLPQGLINQLAAFGWTVIPHAVGKELILVTVTKPWEPNPPFRALSPEEFARFDERGYAKIALTLRAEPIDDQTCEIQTETRVKTTDPVSRARFRRYWAFLSPGIALIRIALLQQVKREAKSRSHNGHHQTGVRSTR